jgi:TonB family protein
MKICPTCQQQFPNGFQYCPNDTDMLLTAEDYLRRTKPIAQTPPPAEPVGRPASEATPLTRPLAQEAPKAPATEHPLTQPVSRPAQQQAEPVRRPPQTAQAPTAPVAPPTGSFVPPAAERPGNFNPAQRNAPPPNKPIGKVGSGALVSAGAAAMTNRDDLSFSVPDQGGLIERLSAALRNISESFKSGGPVKPGDTGDFHFLIKDESLVQRVGRELQAATDEFKRDPKTFIVTTIKGEGTSKQRQRWLLNGIAGAVITYSLFFFAIPTIILLIWGNNPVIAEEKKEDPLQVLADLTMPTTETKVKKAEVKKGKGGFTGGEKPVIKQAHGGGGANAKTPASKGAPPLMALTPQIIPPNPEPPKIKNPSLVVASTAYGDPKALPQIKGPIGDPLGVPAPPTPGSGGGTGIGQGQGGGVGRGRGGNAGGGDSDFGGGRGTGGSGGVEEMGRNGAGRPTILYKEKAKYTEEARQNKVQGIVVLNVIFTAEGRITNVRVVRGLPDGLTEKAIEAAQRIRFNPATKNGAPVSVRGNLEFSFNLY